MTTPSLPEELNHIWAKSASRGFDDKPEPLAQHTLFAIERFADTIRLRPNLPARIGAPRLWNNLFWACFLHDFGKAAKGFQDMLHEGKRYAHRHEVLSLAFLDWLGVPLSEDDKLWIAAAIVSHHKDADEIQRLYSTIGDPDNKIIAERLAEIDDSTLGHLWDWLAKYPKLWIDDLQLDNNGIILPSLVPKEEAINSIKNKGAANIRRWLNAYGRWIRKISKSDEQSLILGTIALRGFTVSSDHLASAHAGELPPSKLAGPEKLLERFKLSKPYYHQFACINTHGSAILMAPTGSGKTEASLLWAMAQAEEGISVPRLYYTLPYQASMNAMFDRLNNEKDGAFPGQVGLEHSRSTLAYYRMLEDEDTTDRAKHAKKFSNLARLNYYPIRVLSPYQILKAPYCLKGYESILSDCFNSIFILDEVHAYEAKRLALILGTVKYLREQYGAKFFIMSATLPMLLRDRLNNALGSYKIIEAAPDLYTDFERHKLELRNGEILDKEALDEIADRAKERKSVLVCCNTVKRAQQAFKELQKRLGPQMDVVLIHGRFNGKDRLDKEKKVRETTGSKTDENQRKAIVLVSTQVVEVSLDIDLNMIYTDPAPLEALLQRFGRVNRRRKIKPYAPVFVFREPADGQRIYKEKIVRKALEVLEKNDGEMIDEASTSKWLDEVYCGEIAKEWSDEYQSAYDEFWDVISNLRAFNSEEGLEDMFYQAFDSIEVLPLGLLDEYTRMAEDNPLEASQLLVSIRWGQYVQLKNKGMVSIQEPYKIKVVDAYYDSTSGLDLKRTYGGIDAK